MPESAMQPGSKSEQPVTEPYTYVADVALAETIALATATDEAFLGYARRYGVPLLVGAVEAAQGRIREADVAARETYAAEQTGQAAAAGEAAEQQQRDILAEQASDPNSLISRYPVFGTVCDNDGQAQHLNNQRGAELMMSRRERVLSATLGRVTQDVVEVFKNQPGHDKILTVVDAGDDILFAYHTPNLLTGGETPRPRVSLAMVVPRSEYEGLIRAIYDNPYEVINLYPQLCAVLGCEPQQLDLGHQDKLEIRKALGTDVTLTTFVPPAA